MPRDSHFSCNMSSVVAAQLGAYGYKPSILNEILKGKRVDLDYSEGAFSRAFRGELSPTDLETALQLVHLLFQTR